VLKVLRERQVRLDHKVHKDLKVPKGLKEPTQELRAIQVM
jgi:hypothetical protein